MSRGTLKRHWKHISQPPFYQFGLSINVSNAERRRHYRNMMTVNNTWKWSSWGQRWCGASDTTTQNSALYQTQTGTIWQCRVLHTHPGRPFIPSLLPSFTFSFNFQMECCDAIAGGEQHLKGLAFFISPRCICVDTPPCHCQIVCFTSSLSPLCDLKETSGQRDGWETAPPSLFHQADAKCGFYKHFPLEGWF